MIYCFSLYWGAYKEIFLVKVTGQMKRKKESCYKLRNEEVCLFNNSKINPRPSLHLFVCFILFSEMYIATTEWD